MRLSTSYQALFFQFITKSVRSNRPFQSDFLLRDRRSGEPFRTSPTLASFTLGAYYSFEQTCLTQPILGLLFHRSYDWTFFVAKNLFASIAPKKLNLFPLGRLTRQNQYVSKKWNVFCHFSILGLRFPITFVMSCGKGEKIWKGSETIQMEGRLKELPDLPFFRRETRSKTNGASWVLLRRFVLPTIWTTVWRPPPWIVLRLVRMLSWVSFVVFATKLSAMNMFY